MRNKWKLELEEKLEEIEEKKLDGEWRVVVVDVFGGLEREADIRDIDRHSRLGRNKKY
jgi:hypothetical protein